MELHNWQRLLARRSDQPTSLLQVRLYYCLPLSPANVYFCLLIYSFVQFQGYVNKLRDAFTDLDRLLTIACTLPVSTCECERVFSTLRVVKNYLRSTMTDERLLHLMILGIHSSRAQAINLDDVVNIFSSRFPHCRIILA